MNVKLKYKVLEDYALNSSRLKVSLKKGIEISEDDLIKKFGGEKSFEYLMSCTTLKKVLEVCLLEEGSAKEEATEEGSTEEGSTEIIFTIKEDLYRGKSKNVLVEKGSKVSLKELKLNFSNSQIKKFVSNKQIMETKVSV
jgi:hypothetical protein